MPKKPKTTPAAMLEPSNNARASHEVPLSIREFICFSRFQSIFAFSKEKH
jgi:hypothetical protein